MESILTSIKQMLGITKDFNAFDTELIIHINSVFSILEQIFPLAKKAFSIENDSTKWSEYIEDRSLATFIKSYMYMKVRTMFDPPTGAVLNAFNDAIKEMEWRLSIADNLDSTADNSNTAQEP